MIDDLNPYSNSKDSGVPWLGEIPSHWEVRRNGRLFRQRNETGFAELPILEVSLRTGVRVRDMDNSNRKQIMSDRAKYKRARQGDIAYNMMRMWQGAVGVVPVDGLVSPAYIVAEPFPEACAGYFDYLFRTNAYMDEVNKYSRGIVSDRNRLYWEDFKQMPSPFPPPEEQAAIVRFLDHADRRIRRYIRAKRQLIALLNEQKQAVIHQAVTRGLDPNVRLKPSGVEWLGDVPEHWEKLALKHILWRLIDCEHKTAPAVDISDYFVVRTTAVRNGHLHWEGTYCTTPEAFCEWTQRGRPEPRDVIFTREAPAGEACLVPHGRKLCLGQRTVLMKVHRAKYDPQFLIYMIYAGPPNDRIKLLSQGSTVGHFNMDDIGWMPVLMPPLQEQQAVVSEVEAQSRIIDRAISDSTKELELLREYRIRLIADVVTGKMDVREAADRLPEELDDGEPEEELLEGDGEESELDAEPEEVEA